MDLSGAFTPISVEPVAITADQVVFATACGPRLIPSAWVPTETAAAWMLHRSDVALELRLRAALDLGRTGQAFELISRNRTGTAEDPRITAVLNRWVEQESLRLALPPKSGEVVVLATHGTRDREQQIAQGLEDVRQMLDVLPWPRWAGPLVVVAGREFSDLKPGSSLLSRPALPVIRLPEDAANLRTATAGLSCRLYLALSFPPPGDWPAWFATGLEAVAEAKSRGEGPSPEAMLRRRKGAGVDGIRAVFKAEAPDRDLAMAVVAPLCHSRRKERLRDLLELLRNRADPVSALEIAYGIKILDLIERR